MASANKVILLGHLGTKPEVAYTQNGTAVCNMRLATNHVYKDREGNKQEHTNWINLKSFGRQAEVCGQYLNKGRQIYVEGRLQTDSYEDGRGVRRTKAEVITNQVVFLSEQNSGRMELSDPGHGSHSNGAGGAGGNGNGNGNGNGGNGNGGHGNGGNDYGNGGNGGSGNGNGYSDGTGTGGNGGTSHWASSGEPIPLAEPAEDD
jgi:single-strand DNA-binding protein